MVQNIVGQLPLATSDCNSVWQGKVDACWPATLISGRQAICSVARIPAAYSSFAHLTEEEEVFSGTIPQWTCLELFPNIHFDHNLALAVQVRVFLWRNTASVEWTVHVSISRGCFSQCMGAVKLHSKLPPEAKEINTASEPIEHRICDLLIHSWTVAVEWREDNSQLVWSRWLTVYPLAQILWMHPSPTQSLVCDGKRL